jgi:hypothetical protein
MYSDCEEWTSSGILRRVALVGTDFSDECIVFIIRVKEISKLGKTLAITRY